MPAKITKTSPISGITRTMEFGLYSQVEFDNRYHKWQRGEFLIQEAFPLLTSSAREFIKTGITEEEWNTEFGAVE